MWKAGACALALLALTLGIACARLALRESALEAEVASLRKQARAKRTPVSQPAPLETAPLPMVEPPPPSAEARPPAGLRTPPSSPIASEIERLESYDIRNLRSGTAWLGSVQVAEDEDLEQRLGLSAWQKEAIEIIRAEHDARVKESETWRDARIRQVLDARQQAIYDEMTRIRPIRIAATVHSTGFVASAADAADAPWEVEWRGTWYPASALQVQGDRTLIRYAGYSADWDEWVGPQRIRPRGAR